MEIDKEFKETLELQLEKTLEKVKLVELENRVVQTKLKNLREQRDIINKLLGKGKGKPKPKKGKKEPTEVETNEEDEDTHPFDNK